MKVGDLIEHITSGRYGIIIEIMDYAQDGNYYNILWDGENDPYWVYYDLIKDIANESW